MAICSQCGGYNKETASFCVLCGAPLTAEAGAQPDPLLHKVIGHAYILQELIGLGGMGRVYRAEQKTLGRTVAVKVIHPHLLSDSQSVLRFYNEARAASRLNHPNSVGIIDFGKSDDGTLYLVMEHIIGVDLARVLGEEGPVPFRRSAEILLDVLSALDEAHALGVVHRDLKPENIILKRTRAGTDLVKVVDFGLATITTQPASLGLNTPGMVCGTPDYMAPEQARGEQVDGRADLYAVGVMLFELLADRLPFEDEVPARLVMKHIHDPIPDPRQTSPHRGIPDALAEVAMYALKKDRDKRFQTANEMHTALREALSSLSHSHAATTRPPSIEAPKPVPTSGTSATLADLRAPYTGSLIKRDVELAQLRQIHERAKAGARWVRFLGPVGAGKSALMRHFADRMQSLGDFVIHAGPHPRRALEPYATIKQIAEALCQPYGGWTPNFARTLCRPDPSQPWRWELAQRGVDELFSPKGVALLPMDLVPKSALAVDSPLVMPRYDAVATWLHDAITHTIEQRAGHLVLLAIDDIDQCDACSVEVLARLSGRLESEAIMILSAATFQKPHLQLHDTELTVPIKGFMVEDLPKIFRSPSLCTSVAKLFDNNPSQPIAPLFIDQLQHLQHTFRIDDVISPQLADVIVMQMDRLDPNARKTLQASALWGDSAPINWVTALIGQPSQALFDNLTQAGWGEVNQSRFHFRHPFVRQVIENTVPAAAKASWHDRILEILSEHGGSTEERAFHASRGSDTFQGLLWLDRAGSAASLRGDYVAAASHFREGLTLARKTYSLLGDETMEQALINFTRKLSDAFIAQGNGRTALGLLREAIEWTKPESLDHGRLLVRIVRAQLIQDPPDNIVSTLDEVSAILKKYASPKDDVALQRSLAAAHLNRNHIASSAHLSQALAVAQGQSKPEFIQAAACLAMELAEILIDRGVLDQATDYLLKCRETMHMSAHETMIALEGACVGRLGIISELKGDVEAAKRWYTEASHLCGQGGDELHARKWHQAAHALDSSS